MGRIYVRFTNLELYLSGMTRVFEILPDIFCPICEKKIFAHMPYTVDAVYMDKQCNNSKVYHGHVCSKYQYKSSKNCTFSQFQRTVYYLCSIYLAIALYCIQSQFFVVPLPSIIYFFFLDTLLALLMTQVKKKQQAKMSIKSMKYNILIYLILMKV